MTTKRSLIRKAIGTLIAETNAVESVYIDRQHPIHEDVLSFIAIKATDETSEELFDRFVDRRTLTVEVGIYARAEDGVDDLLDEISDKVQNILAQDATLGGLTDSITYTGSVGDVESAGSVELASLTLTYEVVYQWQAIVDDDEFKGMNVKFDMASPRNDPQTPAHPDGQIDASTRVDWGNE